MARVSSIELLWFYFLLWIFAVISVLGSFAVIGSFDSCWSPFCCLTLFLCAFSFRLWVGCWCVADENLLDSGEICLVRNLVQIAIKQIPLHQGSPRQLSISWRFHENIIMNNFKLYVQLLLIQCNLFFYCNYCLFGFNFPWLFFFLLCRKTGRKIGEKLIPFRKSGRTIAIELDTKK